MPPVLSLPWSEVSCTRNRVYCTYMVEIPTDGSQPSVIRVRDIGIKEASRLMLDGDPTTNAIYIPVATRHESIAAAVASVDIRHPGFGWAAKFSSKLANPTGGFMVDGWHECLSKAGVDYASTLTGGNLPQIYQFIDYWHDWWWKDRQGRRDLEVLGNGTFMDALHLTIRLADYYFSDDGE